MGGKSCILTVCSVLMIDIVVAQECNNDGQIVGAVFGTFFATLVLVGAAYFFYQYYWKNKKDKRLVPNGDPENVKDEFAFDNPGFKNNEAAVVSKPSGWLKLNTSVDKPITSLEAKSFLDDTFPENNRRSTIVPLWPKDFVGLGFEISGSMRDGIYVSRVLRGGPASSSGKIHTGDRINSVRISFRNIVYEDALAILSFASAYELQLEVQSPSPNMSNIKDVQARLSTILTGNSTLQRSPGSTLQISNEKMKKKTGYDSLDKNWKSGNQEIKHPVLGIKRPRCNSYGDVNTLNKSLKHSHLPQPPASPNSTFDSSNQSKNTSLKKMFMTSTLEKNKPLFQGSKEQRNSQIATLEREYEKNTKNKMGEKNRTSDHDGIHKPERAKIKATTDGMISPPDVVIIKDGGDMYSAKMEKTEVQKKEPDSGKKGMKFGIRVLPPNIPDDAAVGMNLRNSKLDPKTTENGLVAEIRGIDEVDKSLNTSNEIKETHVESKDKKSAPVVAKRREKPVAPTPNARTQSQITVSPIHLDMNGSLKTPQESHDAPLNRHDELNSSGIKRDAQGIPQEIPQHMMEAAMYARNNRKTIIETNDKSDKDAANKNSKKSKGKAPSPPELNKSKEDGDYSMEDSGIMKASDLNFTDNFGDEITAHKEAEKNKSDDMILNGKITSTPKSEIVKRIKPQAPEINEESLSYDSKSKMKELSDSLNNFFEDTNTNVSSNCDINSIKSFGVDSMNSTQNTDSDQTKNLSTMIELNSSDITIHSSPTNEVEMDENERKASSLGDLSRLENNDKSAINKKKSTQGTLERAQSLDITSEEAQTMNAEKIISPKKRKSNSVFDGSYYDDINDVPLKSNDSVDQVLIHSKEPRLSLDICNNSMEGLNTFQKNRLKKSSEWGNLEDIIVRKDNSSNSGSSEAVSSAENINMNEAFTDNHDMLTRVLEEENTKLNQEINKLKMLSESNDMNAEIQSADTFKYTSMSPKSESPNRKPEVPQRKSSPENSNTKLTFEIGSYMTDPMMKYKTDNGMLSSGQISPKLEEKLTMIYDTNIPDDIKVSRHSLVSSLERPKSDLMKKLLAQNPVLTSNIEAGAANTEMISHPKEAINKQITPNPDLCSERIGEKPSSTTLTLLNQPDIVNLRIKPNSTDDENETAESDFVSSININGQNVKDESKVNLHVEASVTPEKLSSRNYFSSTDNIVTITTDGSQPSSIITIEGDPTQEVVETFRNSIEIKSELQNNQVEDSSENRPEIVDKEMKKLDNESAISTSKTYFSDFANSRENSFIVNNTETNVSTFETVTINTKVDDLGLPNQVMEVRKFSEVLETDRVKTIEIETEYVTEVKRIVETISPDFVTYNETETRIDDVKNNEKILISDASKFNYEEDSPVKIFNFIQSNYERKESRDDDDDEASDDVKNDEDKSKDFITEIEISNMIEKRTKNTTDDDEFVSEFLKNERRFSSDDRSDSDKSDKLIQNGKKDSGSSDNDEQKSKRHSDYDLPRNTHIKFRTSTYEPPNPLPNKLSLTSEKRLSQIEILKSNFEKANMEAANSGRPSISAKPSNIPIKLPEKSTSPSKTPNLVSPSKIPVLNNQKSVSQENLSQKSPPNFKSSTLTGNISVTSIKSSSRNPSGK